MSKTLAVVTAFVLLVIGSSGCALIFKPLAITDAKVAVSIDENLMPVGASETFPKGTSSVACWIKWTDAKINTSVIAKWHYVTDDIHIIDHTFIIPKKEGSGGVTLSMPTGRKLPPGLYKVDLVWGNHTLKSLKFRVE